uniref:TAFH domain-containing protein n=1 Tax=Panagrolaimus sp. JU765 TaxID=591449 RepID=A0AC34PUS7_9BILA
MDQPTSSSTIRYRIAPPEMMSHIRNPTYSQGYSAQMRPVAIQPQQQQMPQHQHEQQQQHQVYVQRPQIVQPIQIGNMNAPVTDPLEKLIKLLKSFIALCQKNKPELTPKMIKMTEQFILGESTAKEYEQHVTQSLSHAATPKLVDFLGKHIPLLSAEVKAGKISMEQILSINRPKLATTDSPSPQSSQAGTASPQSMAHGPSPAQRPTPSPMQPQTNESLNRIKSESSMNQTQSNAPVSDSSSQQSTQPEQKPFVKVEIGSYPSTSQALPPTLHVRPPAVPEVAYKDIPMEQNSGDRSIFDRQSFAARLRRKMPECDAFEENVLIMLSDYLEVKLREMVKGTITAADHRLEPLQQNALLVQSCDPKKQLAMIEKFEKAEKQRRENLEKEAILKMSKGKGKDSDMLEKAKLIRKADEEAKLNVQTNEAAKAALSGTKRQWTSKNPASTTTGRPRKRQLTMRDIMYVFERDTVAKNTPVYRRLLYGLNPE